MLTPGTLPTVQGMLAALGFDGWLLFDFRGINPVAKELLGLEGMVTRRVFGFVPRVGLPVAITHPIEQGSWRRWPAEWPREIYTSWRALEPLLGRLVRGKRVAMEYSPGDSVPYLDRVPAGVLDLVRSAGADVVSSGELVSRFYATWSDAHLSAHRRAAERIAQIGREAIALAGRRARARHPITEHELAAWISGEIAATGLESEDVPHVAAGPNAADPHYEPSPERPHPIVAGALLLVDLWAREPGTPYADQTWMGSLGEPSTRARAAWDAIRDGRDAAIALLRSRVAASEPVRGAELDDAARAVITARGFADGFTHRTGHSIDARDLHGSGPNLDNFETHEDRLLIAGVGFSIEPGVYVRGEFGMRTEVNAFVGDRAAIVTPVEYQQDLIVV